MLHLSRIAQGMEKVDYPGYTFFFSPDLLSERKQVEAFLEGRQQFASLDVAEEGRAVYLLEGDRVVFKFNRLSGWRKRLAKHFGLSWRPRYCLVDEFSNLRRLEGNPLVPKVYGFGWQRGGILRDEFLLLEFIAGTQTVDEFMRQTPERVDWLLERIVALFRRMCDQGFVHMDPHPKNILLSEDGDMRFIDFECCSFDATDRTFALSFSLGYFFFYWFQRFIDAENYDRIVLGALGRQEPGLVDERFLRGYLRFRQARVSRRDRYACLLSSAHRDKFLAACRVEPERVRALLDQLLPAATLTK